ncbi:MAG: glutathione S-transferase family protein [Burkholderiaceae bacterium]
MKLYNSVGPNPQVVRMFMAEKGIDIPTVDVDIRGGENRREPYLSTVNSRGQCPVLEIDNGEHLCEIVPICEYLEEKHPEPSLIGTTAEQRAETRMWTRRVDLAIAEPILNGYRGSQGLKMFQDRFRVLPEASDGLKAIAQDNLAWLDADMKSRDYLCGDRFSLADIFLYCMVSFGVKVGQTVNPEMKNITAWLERIGSRPSAKA